MNKRNTAAILAAAVMSVGVLAGQAYGQNRPWEGTNMVWTGEGTTSDWNDAGNWAPQAGRKLQTTLLSTGDLVYVVGGSGATGGDIAFSNQNPVFDPTTLDLNRPANQTYELSDFSVETVTVTVPGNTMGASGTRSAATNDNTYDSVTFGAATNLQVNADLNRKIGGVTFTSSAGDYILGEPSATNQLITSGITVQGNSGAITINSPIRHLGDANMVPNAGRTLDINGTTTIANGRTILFTGTGVLNYDGQVVSDSAGGNFPGIRILGGSGAAKTLNLNNENFRLNLSVDGGQTVTVNLNAAGALPGSISLGSGSLFVSAENALNGLSDRHINISGGSTSVSALMEISHGQSYAGNTLVGLTTSTSTQGDAALWVNNPTGSGTGSGDVTIYAGVLGGNGFIVNTDANGVTLTSRDETDTSIRSYGKLSPGAAAGEVGTLTMDLGSKGLNISAAVSDANTQTLLFDLVAPGSSDQVSLLNATVLDIGTDGLNFDDFVFNLPGTTLAAGTYTLFDSAQTINGSLGSSLSGTLDGKLSTLSLANNSQDLVLTVVPEPGALSVLAIGGLGLLARRRMCTFE